MKRGAGVLAVGVICVTAAAAVNAPIAAAQPAGGATVTQEAAAQALFDEGQQLLSDGKVTDACRRFEASQEMDPGAGTELNLANCYEKAGLLASAWVRFKSAGSNARRSARPQWGVVADDRAKKLEPRVPRVVIRLAAEADGGQVPVAMQIDGLPIPTESFGLQVPLDPGEHRLLVTSTGRTPFERGFAVTEGKIETIDVPPLAAIPSPTPRDVPPPPARTEAAPPPPAPQTTWMKTAGYVLGAAGIVGLTIGAGYGVDAIVKQGELDCRGNVCNAQALSDGRNAATFADVGLLTGAVLATAGIVLVVTGNRLAPRQAALSLRFSPVAGADRAGLELRGQW